MAIASGSSIEAVLTLNASGFHSQLEKSTGAVKDFVAQVNGSAGKINSFTSAIDSLFMALEESTGSLVTFNNQAKGIESFNKFANGVKALAMGIEQFNAIENSSKYSIEQHNSALRKARLEEERQAENLRILQNEFRNLASAINGVNNSQNRHTITAEKLAMADKEVIAMENQKSASMQKAKASTDASSTSMNRATTSAKGLGKALSNLKMMGTMVGSMIAYNFLHNLAMATTETINAKSEMNGYFQMLGYTTNQVNKFNKALDETVKKYPRLNKYALGETISSIGVEFELTTKEMEKAMPVVSMITSEYLRAGRNVNESSLAVKDILQGEFQRLSRETGVKQDTLKEAGWSGDKTDVMGLLEALEKVGKARHWDTFVEKANSLNDAVLILQNRFSEWSADMVEVVQPAILNVFNTLLQVGSSIAPIFEGIWKWFNGDGMVETAVRWGTIATAIGSVVTALAVYRTGANLTQFVQMGLRGSIIATTLGLDAETVATYNSRTAIVSRLTGLKAEQVAEMGVKRAIATKVLGLEAEMVANNGVKGAIMASTFARELEEASLRGATISEKANIVAKQQEQLANMSTLKTIFAHIAGVKMETFAEKGLIVALAERIARSPLYIGSLKAEEVAELSTAEAGLILAGTLAPLIAIFVGVAVAVYGLIKPLQDASEEMKKFNNLVENGDDIIKEHKKSYDDLSKSYDSTKSKLDSMDSSSKKYLRTQKQLDSIEKDKKTAYDNWQNSIKAVEMARSSQAKFEEERDKIAIHNQTLLADAYAKAGFSARESSEMASHELNEAKAGAEQLRKALQMLKFEADKGAKKNAETIDMLDQYGISKDKIKEYGTNLSEAQYKISEGLEKFMTSDDLMGRVGGWFEIQQGRFEEWWTEFNAFFEVRDWDSMRDKLLEGIKYVFTGFGAFDWVSMLGDKIGEKGLVGAISDALFGEGDSDGMIDIISQWGNDMIVQPLGSWLAWFLEDPVKNWDQITDDLSLALGKFLFGKDSGSLKDLTDEWIKNNITDPISNTIMDFVNDPLKYIIGAGEFVGVSLIDPFYKMLFGDDADAKSDWQTIKDYFAKIDILGAIFEGISESLNGGGESSDSSGSNSIAKKIDISSLLGDFDLTQWFDDNVKKPVMDWWNGFISFDWLPSFDISGLINGFFGTEEDSSTTDSTTNPLITWVNNNIVTPLINFAFDPLGTIASWGLTLPQINLGALIQGLFSIGGEGGFDIGGWLSSVFNISGIVSNFTSNLQVIFTTASGIASNVSGVFSNLKSMIWGHIQGILSNVTTTFTNIKNTAVTQINGLRSGIQGGIDQVKSAFVYMKDSILDSAKKIYDGVKAKFDSVKTTIGDFWHKLTNPSSWGAGSESYQRSSPKPHTARKMFSPVIRSATHHGAGINPYKDDSQSVRLKDLMDVVSFDNKVKLSDFLAMFSEGGFGTWDFHEPVKTKVFDTAKGYKTGSPNIKGIGTVGSGYEVRKFWNGKPSFSFEEFQAVAQAIFSTIPYKFYYDSEWKGNWVNALLSGAVNCSDGADALIALASVFGFDGYKQHTTLKSGIGHFFAVINGKPMDTTNFYNHGSWSPLGGAGIPTRTSSSRGGAVQGNTTNHTVNVTITGDVYGVDDLENRIEEGVKKGLREEFNDPYTVAI